MFSVLAVKRNGWSGRAQGSLFNDFADIGSGCCDECNILPAYIYAGCTAKEQLASFSNDALCLYQHVSNHLTLNTVWVTLVVVPCFPQ